MASGRDGGGHRVPDEEPEGSALRVLRQVTGRHLPGAPPVDAPAGPEEAAALVELAGAHRVSGPLLAAWEDGALELSDEAVDRLVATHESALLWCLRIERRLLEVDGWFRAAGGIEYLVLKGPAVAHLDEVDPSLRAFVDVDLLVAARHMDRALEVLAENGVQRRLPRRRAGFDRRFGKGVGCRSADGVEVDVHRTLTTGALGLRISLDELFEAPEPFEVGGVDLRAPALPHRALHAAYHAVVGTAVPPLRTVRDLAGYLSRPDIAPEVLVPIARRWGGETVLALAVEATLDTLAFEAPAWAAWLARTRPDPRDVALVARSRTASAWPVEWSVLRELGPVDGTRFAWSVAFPDPSFLEHRGHSRRARLRAGLGRLRRG